MASKINTREPKIEKIVLSCSGVKEDLNRYFRLLGKITDKTPVKKKTSKRIPGFGVRPDMEVGCMITLRNEEAIKLLARLLSSIENKLKRKQIADNHFSFGIEEYITIPNVPYDREIGMAGLKVTVAFMRQGKRVARKKIKTGKLPKKQIVTKEEIINFMERNFGTKII